MAQGNVVDMGCVPGLHGFQDGEVLIVRVLHTSRVGEGHLGQPLHPVHKGVKYGGELLVLQIADHRYMKLKIVGTEILDRLCCVQDFFHFFHIEAKLPEQPLCFPGGVGAGDLHGAVGLQSGADLEGLCHILLCELVKAESLAWDDVDVTLLHQPVDGVPEWGAGDAQLFRKFCLRVDLLVGELIFRDHLF